MTEMTGKPKIDQLNSYKEAPWVNIVHEDENVIVYKDGFPVTEGHLLFVPKKRSKRTDITICFEYAYDWGVKGVRDYKWEGFNVGINQNECAGQSVMWPHVHLIPRRRGDTPNPKGGVRHVIPYKGDYDGTENKKKYKSYRDWKKKIPMAELEGLEKEYSETNKLTKNEVAYIDESTGPWSTWKSITN